MKGVEFFLKSRTWSLRRGGINIVLIVLENRNAESVAGLELVIVDRDPSLTLRDFRKNRSPDHPITAITRFL